MESSEVLDILATAGVLVRGSHIVRGDGRHVPERFFSRVALPDACLGKFGRELALRCATLQLGSVRNILVRPGLEFEACARNIASIFGARCEFDEGRPAIFSFTRSLDAFAFSPRVDDGVLRGEAFLVTDFLTWNTDMHRMMRYAESRGITVRVVGAICSIGDGRLVRAEDLGVSHLISLAEHVLHPGWIEGDCELCRDGVRVDLRYSAALSFRQQQLLKERRARP